MLRMMKPEETVDLVCVVGRQSNDPDDGISLDDFHCDLDLFESPTSVPVCSPGKQYI